VAIVIGFESSTIFVQAKDEDRLVMLNSAMQAGGIPVGLIAADKTGNELTILANAFIPNTSTRRIRRRGLFDLTDESNPRPYCPVGRALGGRNRPREQEGEGGKP
jgi:hypothetical protein